MADNNSCTLYAEKRELVRRLEREREVRIHAETEAKKMDRLIANIYEYLEKCKRPTKSKIYSILETD